MRRILKSSCRMHLRVKSRVPEPIFSRSCVKFNDRASLGPRGRGPSLRAFLLLAELQIVQFLCYMIDSLMVCCAIHIILPRCCKQWLQCERSLHRWVVTCLELLLHTQLDWSLHHLLPYWLSANAHVSSRRLLRTPPHLPFLGRGVPQVFINPQSLRLDAREKAG